MINTKKNIDSFSWTIVNDIPVSRYIASWYNAGGDKITYGENGKFSQWLKSLVIMIDH